MGPARAELGTASARGGELACKHAGTRAAAGVPRTGGEATAHATAISNLQPEPQTPGQTPVY